MSTAGPIYRKIEFCKSPCSLWGKLESGRWDWIGIKPDGNFMLGSPAAKKRSAGRAGGRVSPAGLESDEHRVRARTFQGPWVARTFRTADEAREYWPRRVSELRNLRNEQPILYLTELKCDGQLEAKRFIVARPPNYR